MNEYPTPWSPWPLRYTGHLVSKSTQFRHGGLFHVWVPLFGRIGQLPPNGFQISMVPLKQWTLRLPISPSATSSLDSPLYLTCTTRSIVPLCFNQNSRLPDTPLLFLFWGETVLGVTKDVPPWGRSVHQGLMMAILRPTPPLSTQHATLLFVNSAMHSLL